MYLPTQKPEWKLLQTEAMKTEPVGIISVYYFY